MQFILRLAPLALLGATLVAASLPPLKGANDKSCTTGSPQCCNSMVSDDAQKKALANLGVLNNIEGLIGVQCTAIAGAGGAVQSQCKSSPVCCSGTDNSGIVSRFCSLSYHLLIRALPIVLRRLHAPLGQLSRLAYDLCSGMHTFSTVQQAEHNDDALILLPRNLLSSTADGSLCTAYPPSRLSHYYFLILLLHASCFPLCDLSHKSRYN